MNPIIEQTCLDRIEHLATMIRQHQEDGNYDAAILLSESALELTTLLDSSDGELWTADWLGEPQS